MFTPGGGAPPAPGAGFNPAAPQQQPGMMQPGMMQPGPGAPQQQQQQPGMMGQPQQPGMMGQPQQPGMMGQPQQPGMMQPNQPGIPGMPAGPNNGMPAPGMGGGPDIYQENIDLSIQVPDRILRLTSKYIPTSATLGHQCKVPLGAVIRPLAPDGEEEEDCVKVIQPGAAGIVRCKR